MQYEPDCVKRRRVTVVEETITYSSGDNSAINETSGRPNIQPDERAKANPTDGRSETSPSGDRTETYPTGGISDSMEHSSIAIPVTETVTPYLVEQIVSLETETVREPEADITALNQTASTEDISPHLEPVTASNDATESTDPVPTSSLPNPKIPPSLEGK